MNQDVFARIAKRLPSQQGQQSSAGGDAFDWLGNFVRSGAESIPELVGITPSTETQEWRMNNPVAGFISEIGGMSIPYAGWFAATKRVKKFNDAIEKIGDLNKAPFLTGAAREAARFAPFEAGRVLANQMVGDRDFGSMAGEAVVNLALGAGIGGVIEGVAAAGTRNIPIAELAPGIDIAAPIQFQQRFLQQILDEGQALPQNVEQINYRLKRLRDAARAEKLPEGVRYVAPWTGATKSVADGINRIFKPAPVNSGFVRRRFVQSKDDFPQVGAWESYATQAGLPKNFEDYGQYFRAISFRGAKADQTAGTYFRFVTKGMEEVGNGWWLKREGNDGLFVMTRKVVGDPKKASASDEWIAFKTDQPGKFIPDQQKWSNTIIGKNAWVPQASISKDGGEIYDVLAQGLQKFPLHNYMAMPETREGIAKWLDATLPKSKVGRKTNELLARTREAMLEYLAPAGRQFLKSPRANYIHTNARLAYDAAETLAQKLTYGAMKLNPTKSLFHSMLRGKQGELDNAASVKVLMDSLSDGEVEELWKVWRGSISGDALNALKAKGEISEQTWTVAKKLEEIDNQIWASLNKTQEATGNPVTKKRQGHYGLSHQWQGDSRIVLRDEGGAVIGIAAGFNRRGAQARAKELKELLELEGKSATIAEEFQLSQIAEIPKDLKPIINRPGFILERQGIRGFRWDDKPFTREEFVEALAGGIHGRLKFQANMAVDDLMAEHLTRLATEDPHAYRLVVARLNDMAGKQGPLGQIQNQIADKILAPVLGQNSASRIVGMTNSMMWTLQLGAMKLSYPIQGALTFLQTVAPEVAFITTASDQKLAGTYTYFAAGGTKGPVGAFGALSPLKMMARGFKDLKKPSPGLQAAYERALNERVIDPRFVEEYVGESATKLSDLKTALRSGGDFVGWLKALNEFLPGLSERFQRGHAFAVGYDLAKNFLKIADEDQAYRLARQFTEKTMFLYNVADRPRIFTTPAGSFLGLFKNWMMNYVGMMVEYSGEAMRGNFAPLAWQTAGTFAVGGLAGTPLYLVADGFSNAFTGQGIMETIYEGWEDNQSVADGLMYGLPAGLTGISLYSQTASPLSNPVRDANMFFSTAHLDRLQYLSKAMGGAWDHWQATGEHPGNSPQFLQQLVRAVAPVSLYRTLGAAQEGMITSLTSGYPIMKTEGLWDKLFYAAGFNPVEMDRAYAVSEQLFYEREKRRAEVGRLGQAFAEAQMNRDNGQMMLILKRAYASGIDPSSVLRSAQARVAKMTTPMLERNFKPEDLARFQAILATGEE